MLLVTYSELELGLLNAITIGLSMNTALKAMYRIRGETARINIASGIGRQQYVLRGLEVEFDQAIAAVRHCLRVRNKFSHAYWHSPSKGVLCYVSLEDLAEEPAEVNSLLGLDFFYVDEALLQEHLNYFQYTKILIAHVNYQSRVLSGEMTSNPIAAPQQRTNPPLYTKKGLQGSS
jgi:hypothetical protein